jgi:signal transduction histidine kinase
LPWDLARNTDVDSHGNCCAKPGEAVGADPTTTVSGEERPPMTIRRRWGLRRLRSSWVDIAWVIFVGLNLAAMRLLPDWQTVPFLIIWVSLTVIYGFRMWRLQPTIMTLAAVTVATGGVIGVQVLQGQEEGQYLVEVPLIAMMFLVMVWHGRRRLAVMGENLRLLEQQRRFIQDASHELGTPITVALGHTQLIEQAATDPVIADDARVVADELLRLRRLAARLLLLASAGSPDFLDLAPVEVNPLMVDALNRWTQTPRRWWHGLGAEATVLGDRDRLALALDALIENAVSHTDTESHIELSSHLEGASVVLGVADSGDGIPAAELERIFDRFARVDPHRNRKAGGVGLGLAIVKAIAEAHHGSVRAHSTPGQGSLFEMVLPQSTARRPVLGPRRRADPASTHTEPAASPTTTQP